MIYTTERIQQRLRVIKATTGFIRRCYDRPVPPGPYTETMKEVFRRKARALDNEAAFLLAMSRAIGGDNGG